MNSRELAMREPALAILMCGLTANGFGADYQMPNQNPAFRAGFGDAGMGFGGGMGGGAPPMPQFDAGFGAGQQRRHHPHHQHHAMMAEALANPGSTEARSLELDPNRDSTVKVEYYSFSFSPNVNLVLGTASGINTFTQNPSTSIKTKRVVINVPVANFVLLSQLQIANVNVFVGGTEDAWTYNPQAQNVYSHLPRLDPQNRASAAGTYTGVLPPGYAGSTSFQLIVTLQGPSTMAGGYGQ